MLQDGCFGGEKTVRVKRQELLIKNENEHLPQIFGCASPQHEHGHYWQVCVAIYGRISAKEKIVMMPLILLWQRNGSRLVKCVFDEWWLWERRWRMETNVPYSSIDEFGYSVSKNGERKNRNVSGVARWQR
jgi:hypothetical protein